MFLTLLTEIFRFGQRHLGTHREAKNSCCPSAWHLRGSEKGWDQVMITAMLQCWIWSKCIMCFDVLCLSLLLPSTISYIILPRLWSPWLSSRTEWLRSEKSGYVWLSVFHPSSASSARCHLSQEIAIAMRSNRGPVAMTKTRGELLHLPLGFPVNPMALGSFQILPVRIDVGYFWPRPIASHTTAASHLTRWHMAESAEVIITLIRFTLKISKALPAMALMAAGNPVGPQVASPCSAAANQHG